MKTSAANFKAYRLARGVSQRQIAEELTARGGPKFDQAIISKWELGKRDLNEARQAAVDDLVMPDSPKVDAKMVLDVLFDLRADMDKMASRLHQLKFEVHDLKSQAR